MNKLLYSVDIPISDVNSKIPHYNHLHSKYVNASVISTVCLLLQVFLNLMLLHYLWLYSQEKKTIGEIVSNM